MGESRPNAPNEGELVLKSRSEAVHKKESQDSDSGTKKHLMYTRDHIEQIRKEMKTGAEELFGTSEESKFGNDEFDEADEGNEGENDDVAGLEAASSVYVQKHKRMSTVNKTSSPRNNI